MGAELVGRKVAKKFPGYGSKKFKGEVTLFDGRDELCYHIKYEDGDEEDITEKELKRILVKEDKGQKRKKGAAATTGDSGEAATGAPAERAQRGKAQQKRQQEEQQEDDKEEEGGEEQEAAGPSTRVTARRSGKTLPQLTSPSIDLTARAVAESEDLQQLITDVAASSKAKALNVIRYRMPTGSLGQDQPLQSSAVTCGDLCHLSTLFPRDIRRVEGEGEAQDQEELAAEYQRQAEQVLAALEQQLQSVGSGKEHLIHVAVMLREVDKGTPPFAAAWNRWVHPRHLPALSVQESFMDKDVLVSVSAQAAVPPRIF